MVKTQNMVKTISILVVVFITAGVFQPASAQKINTGKVDKKEAEEAFQYLQDIRLHPETYSSLHKFLKQAKISKQQLRWNDTLAKVAETKALDMADKNYFAHVDKKGFGINYRINEAGYEIEPAWIKPKSENFFESICAGMESGKNGIDILLIDEGIPSLGHRKHLLGLDKWNASLYDIGIGYVNIPEGSKYISYMSLIIAKHHW
jgi:hypothetical protein